VACDWHVSQQDTGRRHVQVKNGRRYESIIWVYDWTATCGKCRGGYSAKADAVTAAIAHCRGCTK